MQGTRVDGMDAVWDGEPGSYYPIKNEAGEITGLWFKLPSGGLGRIANKGHGPDPEHEWTITENPDGTVTVDPSILQREMPGHENDPTLRAWHGHLRNGVWEY